jgi:hypothetical protein
MSPYIRLAEGGEMTYPSRPHAVLLARLRQEGTNIGSRGVVLLPRPKNALVLYGGAGPYSKATRNMGRSKRPRVIPQAQTSRLLPGELRPPF